LGRREVRRYETYLQIYLKKSNDSKIAASFNAEIGKKGRAISDPAKL